MNNQLKTLNSQKKYTAEQLSSMSKFQGKFLNTYPHHYDYWVDGKGYQTVYEVRGVSSTIRENYERVSEIIGR